MNGRLLFALLLLAASVAVAGCSSGYGNSVTPTPQPVNTSGPLVVYPGTATVPLGGTVNFTASIDSLPTATFTWSISTATGSGSINSSTGVYTAPTGAVPSSPTVTVTAKSGSATGTATITITSAQPVTITPSALFVPAGTTVNFAATAAGLAANVTSWMVNGLSGGDNTHGHITPSGVYIAPLTPPPTGSTTITAITAAGSGTAVATIVFSTNSFNGPYAFSYSGTNKNGFLTGAGSFTANGATATIANGLEDVIDAKVAAEQVAFAGSFTVAPDGTGTASFGDGSGGAVVSKFQFALAGNASSNAGAPAQQASLLRFDGSGSASGTLNQQDSADLSNPLALPSYVFGFSGVDGHGHMLNVAGEFASTAGFSLSPGVWDLNDPSLSTASAPVTADTTLSGTASIDSANLGSGRGTFTLQSTNSSLTVQTFTYIYYAIDDTHLKVIESDTRNFTAGDIFSAPNSNGFFNASVLKGNYAFTMGGSGQNGPFALGGVLICNGGGASPASTSGSITGGVVDQNGGVGSITLNATVSSETYSIAQSTGRITFTLSSSDGSIGSPTFAAYPTASGAVLMVETDAAKTNVFGAAYLQDSTAVPQGGFAAGFNGIPGVSGGNGDQMITGQFAVNSGAISYGSLQVASGSTLTGQTITQAVIYSPDSNGRGTATINTSSTSYPLAYYTIDATAGTGLFFQTDGQRVLVGSIARQF